MKDDSSEKMDDGTGLCADISARDEARQFLSQSPNKSVAVDHETWELLTEWAEEECRSVGGQIRWLVRKHGGQKKASPQQRIALSAPVIEIEPRLKPAPTEWVQKKCVVKHLHIATTQRGGIVDVLVEYEDPMTNTELHSLFPEDVPLSAVQKQTAGMYTGGLLKRRRSTTDINNDKYQYQLTVAAHRLVDRRNRKRENS